MPVKISIVVFWVIIPCSQMAVEHVRGNFCLHLVLDIWSQKSYPKYWYPPIRLHSITTTQECINSFHMLFDHEGNYTKALHVGTFKLELYRKAVKSSE
jgi:hypothetical protein